MGYDWRRLERREREASDRLTLGLGLAWVAVGVVGLIVILVTRNTRRLDTAIFWFAIGLVLLAISVHTRRKKRSQTPKDAEGP